MLLQGICKFWILPVRQIKPFLVFQLGIRRVGPHCSFLLILVATIPPNEYEIRKSRTQTDHDGYDGRGVMRSVLRTEGLWSYRLLSICGPEKELTFIPIILPTQYAIRYMAATVVFLV